MESFEIENGRLLRYHGTAEDITVPAGVREIGEAAFEGCTALQSITLPQSLQEIGDRAFRGCQALEEVRLSGRLQDKWILPLRDRHGADRHQKRLAGGIQHGCGGAQ